MLDVRLWRKVAEPVQAPSSAAASSPQELLFPLPGDPQWPPQRAFAAVALDNLLDSVVDIGRHLRRMNVESDLPAQQEQLVPGGNGRMRLRSSTKPVVLVLGSGWGAHSLIKVIDTDMYDVVVVSPRNHFVFTPMLPSTAVGTVEFRSLLEPIRTSNPCVTYLEAQCETLDPEAKVAVCTSSFAYDDGRRPQFEIQYDKAVVAVGEQPATFGVPGVKEHCFFMKEISDAVALRSRIAEKFELASLPGTSEADRRAALNFVVVGGGPTGVEFAGTLSDFLREDLRKKYPALMPYVRVTLLQSAQSILTQFDEGLGQRALEALTSSGVEVRTGVRVVQVTANKVVLKDGEEIFCGVCVWSAGNAPRPLVTQIASEVPQQAMAAEASRLSPGSKLCVDSFLRVVGASDLLALGDCSLVAGQQGAYLAHLLNSGYNLGVGGYTQPPPFQVVKRNKLQTLTEQSAALQWLANAMMGGKNRIEVAGEVSDALFRMDAPPWIRVHSEALTAAPPLDQPSRAAAVCDIASVREAAAASGGASPEALARAAQECARSFAAEERAAREAAEATEVRYWDRPFEFLSLGIMAYVGSDKALTQVEAFDVINLKLYGSVAFLLWKSVYITKQVSFRNRVLILFDWMKARVFGRDISLF
ncbi:hypothetical protein VOLCADRAFT_105834 [Volvox carteri f. nagariensis]|uniref:NADH:ubiquinone reductase (non-electrogenic) n=1 Tax=Volvox carteri f. nagariensis TaxID=3068 RepID=D8U3G5_VOLCA|nr:uncharacterized protein VOLCADRAFT_105834 [Volvox carteri f. nagariensis]EFJ45820.1 hypothetical protein VOLCADRAFT_105834 [Volvox carteri f. nagariensis]|eukprot:XP_002953221.1 hypothetical protein VOLCADRAFT_105834 [Volvox carteri f. nagariensis]